MITLKKTTLPDFEKGMELYYKKDFETTIPFFEKVIKQNSKDAIAQFFINKINSLMQQELSEDWSGVELMSNK